MHVMLDLETLGKRPGAIIRSIGAVAFDPIAGKMGESFYANVDEESCQAAGLVSDPETIAWWAQQSEAAQLALTVNAVPLTSALDAFGAFWKRNAGRRLWAHGATFDPPLIEAAYAAVNLPAPWRYADPRDTRTIYELADVKPDRATGVHHDAAWDARNQAVAVMEAYRRLGLAPPPQSLREDATNTGAVHHLKTWPVQFQAIKRGDKGFELRLNDRDFREGDTLILLEWDPCRGDGAYTGDWLAYRAGWILYGGKPEFGCAAMPADHCIISLARHPSVRPIGRLAA